MNDFKQMKNYILCDLCPFSRTRLHQNNKNGHLDATL